VHLPYQLAHAVEIFLTLVMASLYTIMLIEFMLNIRSGRAL